MRQTSAPETNSNAVAWPFYVLGTLRQSVGCCQRRVLQRGVVDLAENWSFSGSGRPRVALKPSQKVGWRRPPTLSHPGARPPSGNRRSITVCGTDAGQLLVPFITVRLCDVAELLARSQASLSFAPKDPGVKSTPGSFKRAPGSFERKPARLYNS